MKHKGSIVSLLSTFGVLEAIRGVGRLTLMGEVPLLFGTMVHQTLAEMVIEVAKEEIRAGAGERGGNNRGPFVERYLKPAGLEAPLPWCAAFVSWCIHEAGRRLGVPPPLPYFVSAKRIFHYGKARGWIVREPARGDLVVWSRGAPTGPFGHIGLVEWVGEGKLRTIEGNRTPNVDNFSYIVSQMPRLLGFVRLPEATIPAPVTGAKGKRRAGKGPA